MDTVGLYRPTKAEPVTLRDAVEAVQALHARVTRLPKAGARAFAGNATHLRRAACSGCVAARRTKAAEHAAPCPAAAMICEVDRVARRVRGERNTQRAVAVPRRGLCV